ncbi:MAG: lamin tail domain-containing protein [Chitinophagaceae bacterium]
MRFLVFTLCFLIPLAAVSQERYSVIIQEIMSDPSPTVGLPSYEWIEIRTRSKEEVNLQGWRIADQAGQSGMLAAYLLQPDSILLVGSTSALPFLSAFGPAIAVTSFPSFDNEGETISLLKADNFVIHAVRFEPGWHRNELKKEGGWTLEMIDPTKPCSGKSNWTSSNDARGGTPGTINSVNGSSADDQPPGLLRTYTPDPSGIVLVFDETIDSLKASVITAYQASGIRFMEAFPTAPLFTEVYLTMDAPLTTKQVYTLRVSGIGDCYGNIAGTETASVGIPGTAVAGDLAINEILFNPVPSGYDYVEILNNGKEIVDLKTLHLANRNSSGDLNDLVPLSEGPFLFFPGEYVVATSDPELLALHFSSSNPRSFHFIRSLPGFADDKGAVVLTGPQGEVIDEVNYSEKWHFPLLVNREGIALERINADWGSDHPSNWHSASSASGYGTPGYRNSQLMDVPDTNSGVKIQPAVFSPDNDGLDDLCFIHFGLPSPGYVADVRIYNLYGKLVRHLVRGDLLSGSGYWTWNGLDENGQRLPAAAYIVLTAVFNLEGKTKRYRNVLVLAYR